MIKSEYFKPVLNVEGNIGSGKSTLTKVLAEELNLRPFFEPADNNPYLADFYANMERWAYPMQIHLMLKRIKMHLQAFVETSVSSKWNGAVMDRGLPGDRVFVEKLFADGFIHSLEYETYQEMYEWNMRQISPPTLIVYLDVSPEVCFKRQQERNRRAEKNLLDKNFLQYLKELQPYYDDFIEKVKSGRHIWSSGIEVLEVDWDQYIPYAEKPEVVKEYYSSLIEDIKQKTGL